MNRDGQRASETIASQSRDLELGARLARLEIMDHGEGYWEAVLGATADEMGRVSTKRRRLRFVVAAAAAAAALALVAGVELTSHHGEPARSGGVVATKRTPSPGATLPASQLLAWMTAALDQTRTLKATLVVRDATGIPEPLANASPSPVIVNGSPAPPGGYTTSTSTIVLRDDGSYREAYTAKDGKLTQVYVYNAAAGFNRLYQPASVSQNGGSTEYSSESAEEETGLGAGPPDWYVNYGMTFGYSAFADALRAVHRGTITKTVFEGRPAWVITAPIRPGPVVRTTEADGSVSEWAYRQIDGVRITVDDETGYPVRVQEYLHGQMIEEIRLRDIKVNEGVGRDAFDLAFPATAEVSHTDYGYRAGSLGQLRARVGYDPLVPGWLPVGFKQTRATSAPVDIGVGSEARGTDVVCIRYGNGLRSITVATRRTSNPARYTLIDPFDGVGEYYSKYEPLPNRRVLREGFGSGTLARFVTTELVIPHLWFVKDGLLVTVAGDATTAELLEIANSLHSWAP